MSDPAQTVTLSDGSVWRYHGADLWSPADDEGNPWVDLPYCVRDGKEATLTAADHRAIADVLDPPLLPSPSEPPFDREKQEAVHPDTVRLAVLLKNAFLCPTEDGELLGLFLSENEKSLAVLIVAEASDEEDGSFTAEDAPFLTDTQRNDLNGGVGAGEMKWASDPAVIRAAIDSVSSSLPTPEEQK